MEFAIVSALAFGAGTVMGAVGTALGKETEDSDDPVREAMKQGLAWSMEAMDNAQGAIAEASESFNDLMAEARLEANQAKQPAAPPKEVEIDAD
ncbi:MAG: DUF5132 domain-containing protein [Geitlerinemataceae cyanobacterium]